jgi:putative flippase GtrA
MWLPELFAMHRSRIFFLMRYGISGVTGAVIQVLSLYLWVTVLGLERTYLLGLVLGFIIALIVAFSLQKYWAFRDSESNHIHHQLVKYTIVALSGLALNALLLEGANILFSSLSLNFFQGWYLIVQVISIGIVSVFNFLMNYIFTFSRAREQKLWDR